MGDAQDIGGLEGHFNKRTPAEKFLRLASFWRILDGKKSSTAEMAIQAGITENEAREYIEALVGDGRLVADEQGNIVGSHGLSLIATRHRLHICGRDLFAWCAADAVGIPAALEVAASIKSNCFQCNAPVEIIMSGGAVQSSNHADIRIWGR